MQFLDSTETFNSGIESSFDKAYGETIGNSSFAKPVSREYGSVFQSDESLFGFGQTFKLGTYVKILNVVKSDHRKKTIEKYHGKVGRVVNINSGWIKVNFSSTDSAGFRNYELEKVPNYSGVSIPMEFQPNIYKKKGLMPGTKIKVARSVSKKNESTIGKKGFIDEVTRNNLYIVDFNGTKYTFKRSELDSDDESSSSSSSSSSSDSDSDSDSSSSSDDDDDEDAKLEKYLKKAAKKDEKGFNLEHIVKKIYANVSDPKLTLSNVSPVELKKHVVKYLQMKNYKYDDNNLNGLIMSTICQSSSNIKTESKTKGPIKNPNAAKAMNMHKKLGISLKEAWERIKNGETTSMSEESTKTKMRNTDCDTGYERSKKTGRCVKSCDVKQIRNPASGKCVLRNGAIGRKLEQPIQSEPIFEEDVQILPSQVRIREDTPPSPQVRIREDTPPNEQDEELFDNSPPKYKTPSPKPKTKSRSRSRSRSANKEEEEELFDNSPPKSRSRSRSRSPKSKTPSPKSVYDEEEELFDNSPVKQNIVDPKDQRSGALVEEEELFDSPKSRSKSRSPKKVTLRAGIQCKDDEYYNNILGRCVGKYTKETTQKRILREQRRSRKYSIDDDMPVMNVLGKLYKSPVKQLKSPIKKARSPINKKPTKVESTKVGRSKKSGMKSGRRFSNKLKRRRSRKGGLMSWIGSFF
jgi:hypothetical protein